MNTTLSPAVLTTLAVEVQAALAADSAPTGPRNFRGDKSLASEYVYFRAMRDLRVDPSLSSKQNKKNIRALTLTMVEDKAK